MEPLPISEEPRPSSTRSRKFIILGALMGLLVFAFYAGYQKGRYGAEMTDASVAPKDAIFLNTGGDKDHAIDFSLFWRVWDLLKEKYLNRDELDAKKLFYGAINGMLAATGDPYTTFFDPEENQQFQEELSGSFDGIGAEMGMKNDILTVIAPLDDSPAAKAGIQAGDRVLKIDGAPTASLSLEEAVDHIRGPKGTTVTLSIFRTGEEELRDIAVTRATIVVKSVKFEMKDDIAVIRLSRFGEETSAEFDEAATLAVRNKARGIVLDLRNNPGGFLTAAVDIAGSFLKPGSVAVIQENADKSRHEMKTAGLGKLESLPVIVLINEGSASASEILAGALRDQRSDVLLIGHKSFGKGSVQELIPTSSNTSVKITIAHWLTPKGDQINNLGIAPAIEVGFERDENNPEKDNQLDRALEEVHKLIQ